MADDAERRRALQLRSQIYTVELGHHGVDEFDAFAHHLIAHDSSGEMAAALRILGPDNRPFEIERFVDLTALVPPSRVPAQIGGFWIHPEKRRVTRNAFLPLGMLKLAYAFARKQGITDLVMYTYPRLRSFYTSSFFRALDLEFEHPAWGRVCVLHLDLLELEARHDPTQSTVRFLMYDDLPNFVV